MINEEHKTDYDVKLRDYINARAKLDSFLGDAQGVTEDTANYILTEVDDFVNAEQAAREDWDVARGQYLQ